MKRIKLENAAAPGTGPGAGRWVGGGESGRGLPLATGRTVVAPHDEQAVDGEGEEDAQSERGEFQSVVGHGVHSTAGPCRCQEGEWERGGGTHPLPGHPPLGEQALLLIRVQPGDAGGIGLLAPVVCLHLLARAGLSLHAGRVERGRDGLAVLHLQGAGLPHDRTRVVADQLHGQPLVTGHDLRHPEAVAAARLPGLADVPPGVGQGRGDVAVAGGLHGLAVAGDVAARAAEQRADEVGGDGLDVGEELEHGVCLSGPEGHGVWGHHKASGGWCQGGGARNLFLDSPEFGG